MKHLLTLFVVSLFVLCPCMAQLQKHTNEQFDQLKIMQMPPLQRACAIIKYYEAWHDNPRDPDYIGWGHRIQPHERHLNQNITRAQGDSLLIEDLCKLVKHFKSYGKDALLLSVLCYNVGTVAVCGSSTRPPSKLIQKICSGNRDFRDDYVQFAHWKGKLIPSIQRRRYAEWYALYEE